jgi:hypothetical protein
LQELSESSSDVVGMKNEPRPHFVYLSLSRCEGSFRLREDDVYLRTLARVRHELGANRDH